MGIQPGRRDGCVLLFRNVHNLSGLEPVGRAELDAIAAETLCGHAITFQFLSFFLDDLHFGCTGVLDERDIVTLHDFGYPDVSNERKEKTQREDNPDVEEVGHAL